MLPTVSVKYFGARWQIRSNLPTLLFYQKCATNRVGAEIFAKFIAIWHNGNDSPKRLAIGSIKIPNLHFFKFKPKF